MEEIGPLPRPASRRKKSHADSRHDFPISFRRDSPFAFDAAAAASAAVVVQRRALKWNE